MEPSQQKIYKPKVNITYQTANQQISSQKPIQKMSMQMPIQQMPIQQMPIQQMPIQQMPIQQMPIQQMPMQYQQQAYQLNSNIEYMPNMFHGYNDEEIRLLKQKQQGKKVVAVIVSFCTGGSYDELFTRVQQKSAEGTQVLVYACGANTIKKFIKAISGHPEDEILKEMIGYLKEIDHDCIVFNWECCSYYTSKTFPEGKDQLFKFLKMIMDKGYMAMFSDFSLKALINQWPQTCQLGPNPFQQTGQTSQHFQLHFTTQDLKDSPSAQLQTVGDMAQGGKCNVQAMGGTIVYSVNKEKLKHDKYKLKVLTVANHKVKQQRLKCKVGNFQGTAGHVLLTFKSGGHILTSMGHWMQLMKIDTTDKKLFQIAERDYGEQYANQMRAEYSQLDAAQKKSYVSKNAVSFVQNQAPCSNMSKKAYFKK